MIELLDMLISDNFPDCFERERDQYSTAKQIKDYIDAGQGVSVSLDELEAQFSYSKYYLERQFKNTYGISLIAYKNKVRMQLARQLLSSETVTEVAARMGYSSIYAFSRAYKGHFGTPPSGVKK